MIYFHSENGDKYIEIFLIAIFMAETFGALLIEILKMCIDRKKYCKIGFCENVVNLLSCLSLFFYGFRRLQDPNGTRIPMFNTSYINEDNDTNSFRTKFNQTFIVITATVLFIRGLMLLRMFPKFGLLHALLI